MISNQILQNTIDGLNNITRIDFSIIEREGRIVASTENDIIGSVADEVIEFINSQAESQLLHSSQYFKVLDNGVCEYVIRVNGNNDECYRIGKIAAFQIQNLLIAYKERYDKDNFIKSLLLDNLLLVDIYNRAKKLHIDLNEKRIIYLIEVDIEKDFNAMEIVRNLYASKTKDFVTAIDELNVIFIKELKDKDTIEDIEKLAKNISDTIAAESGKKVRVSIGTVVKDLKDVSRSYKEAKMALEIGKIFNSEKPTINYEQLGIGRLIYQLPQPLCKMYIKEVLHGLSIDDFDDETLTTVDKFFENNLNVSETSRQLFIHRNTLVYRLDKLQKMTGLDLRNFEDAIIFKITLMVSKYMHYIDSIS